MNGIWSFLKYIIFTIFFHYHLVSLYLPSPSKRYYVDNVFSGSSKVAAIPSPLLKSESQAELLTLRWEMRPCQVPSQPAELLSLQIWLKFKLLTWWHKDESFFYVFQAAAELSCQWYCTALLPKHRGKQPAWRPRAHNFPNAHRFMTLSLNTCSRAYLIFPGHYTASSKVMMEKLLKRDY